jgi:outer membrane beta-barrel protein
MRVNRRTLKILSCLMVALLSSLASASSNVAAADESLVEKVAVRNRLFTVDKRFELGANVGLTFLSRLTEHYTLNVSGAYNIADWLAVEARVGYAISRHTSLADQLQTDYLSLSSKTKIDDLSDMWEMTAHGVVGLRFQPIYGKINLVSDVDIHFQLYGWIGGGAGLFKRVSPLICTEKSGSTCNQFYTQNQVGPLVSLALGFRFFIPTASHHSVHVEFRDWSYLDSYYQGVDRANVTAANPTAGGTLSPNAGLTNLTQWDIGYQYIF